MAFEFQNHPFVLWGACFLWLVSVFAITWSLLLFLFVGDMLLLTGTDLVNAFVLLSGLIMLPTNVHILYSIAKGNIIDPKSKVMCCPLWLCIVWIIVINIIGIVLCIKSIHSCSETTIKFIHQSMKHYRSVPKFKHFLDNLQWSLQCCGLNSYKDWFLHDWYDKIRDYEWDSSTNKKEFIRAGKEVTDSVPLRICFIFFYYIAVSFYWAPLDDRRLLSFFWVAQLFNLSLGGACPIMFCISEDRTSCCKSGSCISNYLTELGTFSINTTGCGELINQIILISMNAHLILFLIVIIIEVLVLKFIMTREDKHCETAKKNVNHIMSVKNFEVSSSSYQLNPEDSEDIELSKQLRKEY